MDVTSDTEPTFVLQVKQENKVSVKKSDISKPDAEKYKTQNDWQIKDQAKNDILPVHVAEKHMLDSCYI